ncbi:DUF4062 domain-containing protein [Methylomonas sp. MK1]|uniref:DUF4062 domain-containing protein n=1 Tax=Methylomonas sp. MK1 TaxID=1131552 RepID=UPI000361F8AF|nr:DUF4062 domain-containing protein [Methylomonas sp. MK1]
MEKRYQVFVSSTYADLKDERHKVIQTLMELDCIPAGMELFPATDEDQFEFIKRIIDDCDYYLLIIGGRYGSVTEKGISYTEQEYEYALGRGLKVIALLHEQPNQICFEKSEPDPDLRARLQSFREKVATGRLVKFWNSSKELPGIVALSMPKTIKMFPAIGWVRADKVSSEELLIEINELRKQNAELSKALSDIEPSIFTGTEEKDFTYIHSRLNRLHDIVVKSNYENDADNVVSGKKYSVNLASLVPFISASGKHKYDWFSISDIIISEIIFDENIKKDKFSVVHNQNFSDELLMYGFLAKIYIPPVSGGENSILGMVRGDTFRLIYSEKLERYKYWLNVNGKMPEHVDVIESS